jgi:hypothetical protein
MSEAYQIKAQEAVYFLTFQVVGFDYLYSSARNFAKMNYLIEIDEM